MFNQNGGAYPANADFADGAIYGRALSDAETTAYFAKESVSDSNLVFSFDICSPFTDQIIDTSGNDNNLIIPSGSSWEYREYVPKDLLYLPRDTAEVVSASGTSITVDRGLYSCLENTYKPYYHQSEYEETLLTFYHNGPQFYEGRMIACYQDDDLAFLGFINNITQVGKGWTIQATSILQPLLNGIKSYGNSVALKYSDNIAYWLSLVGLTVTINGSDSIILNSANGSFSYEEALIEFEGGGVSDISVRDSCGYVIGGEKEVALKTWSAAQGVYDILFKDSASPEFLKLTTDEHCSKPAGIKPYGIIAGGSTNLNVEIEGVDASSFLGNFLKITDDSYCKVTAVSGSNMTLEGVYNSDLTLLNNTTAGKSGDTPISLEIAPLVKSAGLIELVYSILTSTGSTSSNGDYDLISGLFGLGIPKELVETLLTSESGNPIIANLEEGKISDDLAAHGLGLIFKNGKFEVKSLNVPILALSAETIETPETLANNRTTLNYGYFHPLRSISYIGYKYDSTTRQRIPTELKISISNTNIFFGSTGRLKKWESSINTDTTDHIFRKRILKVLQWFNSYAPTIDLVLPEHTISICDIVNISLDDMSGQGSYSVDSVAGLIVDLTDDYKVKVVLNTSKSTNTAGYVPSWEIASYTGSTLTLNKGNGLKILDYLDAGDTMQIMSTFGTLETVTLSSIPDDDTVILTAAPSYDQSLHSAFITLEDYTEATVTDFQSQFTWASNTSGVMSNADIGKVLL